MTHIQIEESPISKFLFSDTRMAAVWLVARAYVGWQWLEAGWGKVRSEAWTGSEAGKALGGFIRGSLEKTAGAHPDVQGWYAYFLEELVLPNVETWSQVVAYGELLVGVALIVGVFTGIAAFFGLFMNLNFMLSGAVSTNPVLFTISIGIILAWRISGYYGLDRWLLPILGTPWKRGKLFRG